MPNKSAIPIFGSQQQQPQQQPQQQQGYFQQRYHQQPQQELLTYSNPYSLLQSARRRLQCSQLPVRNPSTRQNCKLANSLRKFTVLGAPRHFNQHSGNNSSARKSLSMVDLSPARNASSETCSNSCKTSGRVSDGNDRSNGLIVSLGLDNCLTPSWTREVRAASLICRALVINSWRRRREEVVQLRTSLATLDQSLEHFKIQIVVLRRLLDNENGRVATLAGELQRAKVHADDVAKERDHLKSEKEVAEKEVQKQREIAEDRLVTAENLRNELRSLQDQVNLLDKQIEKDREKLLKSTEDKKVLLEKVSSSEALAMEREERAQKAELSLEETQMQLATQIALTNSLQEEMHNFLNESEAKKEEKLELEKMLQKIKKENEMMKKLLQSHEEDKRMLHFRALDLENQLNSQEFKLKQIEVTCNAQVLELNEIRERLLRQTDGKGWSSKVFQFAGSVALIPRVILRTLSFITTGILIIV